MVSEDDLVHLGATRITKNSKNDHGFDEEGTTFLFTEGPHYVEAIIIKHIMKTLGHRVHIVHNYVWAHETRTNTIYYGTKIYTNYPYSKFKELEEKLKEEPKEE